MWFQTYSGKRFVYLDHVSLGAIDIVDIARALSRLPRFLGHTMGRHAYSVAQHSWLASRLVPRELAMEALLHDAHEAYLGDDPQPKKTAVAYTGERRYLTFLARVRSRVRRRFGLPIEASPEVREVDLRLLATEGLQLMGTIKDWELPLPPYEKLRIVPWNPRYAERQFLQRFGELFDERASRQGEGPVERAVGVERLVEA